MGRQSLALSGDLHQRRRCFPPLLQYWNQTAFPLCFQSQRDQSGPKVCWLHGPTWNALASSRRKKTRVQECDVFPYPPPISLKLEYACLPTWKSQGFTPHLTPAFDFFPASLIPFKFIAYRERWHARDTNQVPRLAGKAVISPWKWQQHVALQSSIFRTDSPGWQTVTVPIYADVDGATQQLPRSQRQLGWGSNRLGVFSPVEKEAFKLHSLPRKRSQKGRLLFPS